MNKLKLWMDAAAPSEKVELAIRAGTTVGTLNQIAGGYRTGGHAAVRSGLARNLEHAAESLRAENPALPVLLRTDLAPECQGCDFAQQCLAKYREG